jgi:hypothetical protein
VLRVREGVCQKNRRITNFRDFDLHRGHVTNPAGASADSARLARPGNGHTGGGHASFLASTHRGETVPSHVGPIVIVGGIIAILIVLLSLLLPKKRKGSKIRRIVIHNLRKSY